MIELEDHELLAEFRRSGSESAFSGLVLRHLPLVYSAALRFTGNAQHAQEVSQAVFIILARKAGRLRPGVVLSGWLYQTARLTAANFVKQEIRRQRREQEACMQFPVNEPEADAETWRRMAPLLEEAMGSLGETDRNAVVLRFFENKSALEVATTLHLNEAAAHKRVRRALEKLRKFFTKRGVSLSAAALAIAISANSVQSAPAGLAVKLTAGAARGAFISATITTLVKGTMKTMTWMKLKLAATVGAAVLLAGGVATVAISQSSGDGSLTPREILEKSHAAYAALSSYGDSGSVVAEIGGQNVTTTFKMQLQRPSQYHIDWTQTAGSLVTKGVVWSDGSGNNLQITMPENMAIAMGLKRNGQTQKLSDLKTALELATPSSASAASTIPGIFFNEILSDFAGAAASGNYPLKTQPGETVSGVDCYVISSDMIDLSTVPGIGKPGTVATTFWIGKNDFLIHQCRTKYVEHANSAPTAQAIDEASRKSLEIQKKPVTPEAIAAMRPQMEAMMKQIQASLKTSFSTGVVSTQTHENITVNHEYSVADFAP